MSIIDELEAALKDEQEAVSLYTRLADQIDRKGLYRRAGILRSVAADEDRHIQIIKDTIQEVKVIGALVGAAAKVARVYWWVRLGDVAEYERFDTVDEAKKYVEERTGKYFSEAKWLHPYGFNLGPFQGRKYILFFEGNDDAQPTEQHTWGKFS